MSHTINQNYAFADLNDGLIAYYPFNGNANDESGNGNDGLVNGASLSGDRFNNIYSSYHFDGSNDYIGGFITNATNNFSISIWIYAQSSHEIDSESTSGTAGISGQQWIICPHHGQSTGDSGIGVSAGNNGISVYEHASSYMPATLVWKGTLSGWNHVTIVYINKTPNLYINGVFIKSGLTSPKNNVLIGNQQFGGNSYGYYKGYLDDIRFYNRTLTGEEIHELYTENSNSYKSNLSKDLIAYYPFNGNSIDESGYNNNGTVYGATLSEDRYDNADSAYSFDGVDDYIGNFTTHALNNFTISLWINTNTPHEVDSESISGTAGISGQHWITSPHHGQNTGDSGIGVSAGNNGISVYEHASGYMPATLVWEGALIGWNHVTIVYINKTPNLYINGIFVKSGQTSPKNNVVIDDQKFGGMYYGYFEGKLDDIRIYSRALNEGEVHTLYNESNTFILATIDHNKIDENLTDFPVLIHLAEESGTNSFDAGALFDELAGSIDDNTVLYIHSDDEDGSTEITDSSTKNHPVTVNGNVHHEIDNSKFGSSSIYFDGSGDYLTIPYTDDFNLSNGDFTIDAWFNSNSFSSSQIITSKDTYGSNYDWCIQIASATTIRLYTNRTISNLSVTVPTMNIGEWYHVAIVRHNGTNTIYLNGVSYGSNTMGITNHSQNYVTVGCSSWNNPEILFNGYIDELRISKGIARWTENLSPPDNPYNGSKRKFKIYDQNGKSCFTEIEKWDDKNKEAWLWVKVPEVSSTEDTELTIYYDKEMTDQDVRTVSQASDDFNDPDETIPKSSMWSVGGDAEILNNKLHLYASGTKESVVSEWAISGDFDIQHDFDLIQNLPTNQWLLVQKVVTNDERIIQIMRQYNSGDKYTLSSYDGTTWQTISEVLTDDITGKLRLKRVNDIFYAYYWDNGWVELGNTESIGNRHSDDVKVELFLRSYEDNPVTEAYIDNFIINSADRISGFIGKTGEVPAQNVWDDNFAAVWHLQDNPRTNVVSVKLNNEGMSHTANNTLNGDPKDCSDTGTGNYWQSSQ
ncbi:MAG: LamG domain-containing protein, partial [Deltaproteobacteria bacterium]|nr:LamG domain-containing protein [Deltaproteobacteria bacterium]